MKLNANPTNVSENRTQAVGEAAQQDITLKDAAKSTAVISAATFAVVATARGTKAACDAIGRKWEEGAPARAEKRAAKKAEKEAKKAEKAAAKEAKEAAKKAA